MDVEWDAFNNWRFVEAASRGGIVCGYYTLCAAILRVWLGTMDFGVETAEERRVRLIAECAWGEFVWVWNGLLVEVVVFTEVRVGKVHEILS